MKIFTLIILLFSILISINGFKVLGIIPFGSKSHFTIGHSVLKNLAQAGHEVTAISPYPLKKPMKNYKDIAVEDYLKVFFKDDTLNLFAFENSGTFMKIMELFVISWMGTEIVDYYMNDTKVIDLLNSNEKFDVCVLEIFNFDALLGIVDRFDCVLVSYATYAAVKWTDDMTGNLSPPSYVPKPYLPYTDRMTFKERLINTMFTHAEDLIYGLIVKRNQRKLYEKYFPNAKRSFDEMYKSSAIIFMNTHIAYSTARPYLPNMIEIGGIHVSEAKPLPNDIKEFLDSATDGAIIFSMGSVIQAVQWPVEKRNALVKAFSKLKQKVIWKYENETLPNKPNNVMISSWVPQRDILAHENIKLFITHGGLLGTTEALIEGVPVLGLPIFGDQKMNMAKAVTRGYGLEIFFDDISDENIANAINELMTNPKYSENAKIISKRFNDRPMTPQQAVVFWTEYAYRHNGADHLKAASVDLNIIEFYMFDVYSVLFLIALVALYIDYLFVKWLIRKCCGSSGKKLKKN